MALISLILETPWQSHVYELAAAFTRRESADALETWRKLDFTQRFQYLLEKEALPNDDRWLKDAFAQSECMSEKNEANAERFRQDGNKKFQRKWYSQAMDDYTECIRYSTAETVCLGYSNRSAALYHLGKYQHCILDVERALLNGLAEKLHCKVYNRRAHCYKELGCHAKAKEDFEKAIESLKHAEVDEEKRAKLKREIENDMANLNLKKSRELDIGVHLRQRVPEVIGGNSNHLTQASKFVEMKYTSEQGRYLVARCDLNAGDAIIAESPYAAVLLPEFYSTHCHHCFTRTTAPVPCEHCPIALYCTSDCRDLSWKKYHHIECQYLPLVHVIGVAHLALRIVAVTGLQFLQDFRTEAEETYDLNRPYEFGYSSVYHLLHHTDNMQTEDLVHYSICAILLLRCLQKTNFFRNDISTDETATSDSETKTKTTDYYIGGLLLRHLQQLICNAHAVSDWSLSAVGDEKNDLVRDIVDVRVATAIYPTASLMNHSCDPNILSNFYNDALVVRCTKQIKKGEEIFNCYGPHYKRMEFYERKQALEMQYFFTCKCTACSDISTTIERHKALKCLSCEGPLPRPKLGDVDSAIDCSECGKIYGKEDLNSTLQLVFQSQQIMSEGLQAADEGDLERAKERLRQCLKQQMQVLYKEHEDIAATCDQLARVYSLEENYKKAERYVEFSVKIVGRIHGYRSIEYGQELKKLAQIQFNALMIDKCRANVDNAIDILRTNLGEENEQVEELIKMMNCLNGSKGQFK